MVAPPVVDESRKLLRVAAAVNLIATEAGDDLGTYKLRRLSDRALVATFTVRGGLVRYGEVWTPDGTQVFPFWPHGGKSHNLEVVELADAIRAHA